MFALLKGLVQHHRHQQQSSISFQTEVMIALQVLAYQPEVVSFLVNGRHLPVDARALKSGLAPLLAMACARCTCNNASFCQAPVVTAQCYSGASGCVQLVSFWC